MHPQCFLFKFQTGKLVFYSLIALWQSSVQVSLYITRLVKRIFCHSTSNGHRKIFANAGLRTVGVATGIVIRSQDCQQGAGRNSKQTRTAGGRSAQVPIEGLLEFQFTALTTLHWNVICYSWGRTRVTLSRGESRIAWTQWRMKLRCASDECRNCKWVVQLQTVHSKRRIICWVLYLGTARKL